MSSAAPDPKPQPKVHGVAEVSELGQFKQFIYDNYHETHGIFGNEAESAWERRFRGHVPVMRQLLPANKTGPVLDFGCGDGLLLAVAQHSPCSKKPLSAPLPSCIMPMVWNF